MKNKNGIMRVLKFAGVGFATTIFDYVVYEIIVMVVFFGNADFAGIAAAISGVLATFVAYLLHNNITWKERNPGKYGIIKFFIWNFVVVIALRPILTFLFGLLSGAHEFVYMLVSWVPIFSSFDFVKTTTIYVLMMLVTMTLNFIFYEKFVFGSKKPSEKVDMKGVREPGEKEQGERKTKNKGNK